LLAIGQNQKIAFIMEVRPQEGINTHEEEIQKWLCQRREAHDTASRPQENLR
jgi:hypothetical protein